MTKELSLSLKESGQSSTQDLKEKLINSYLGNVHASQAMELLMTAPFGSSEDFIRVAEHLAPCGISMDPIIEKLEQYSENGHAHYRGEIWNWALAKVHVQVGNYDRARQIAGDSWVPYDVYLYLGKVLIDRGLDGRADLLESRRLVDNFDLSDPSTSRGHQVSDYIRIGEQFVRAGEIETATSMFGWVETVLDKSRQNFKDALKKAESQGKDSWDSEGDAYDATEVEGFDADYNHLSDVYARAYMFVDAVRVARKLKEDKSHYFEYAIKEIVKQGRTVDLDDEALRAVEEFGGPDLVHAMAQKAITDPIGEAGFKQKVDITNRLMNGEVEDNTFSDWKVEQAGLAFEGGNFMAGVFHLATAGISDFDKFDARLTIAKAHALRGDFQSAAEMFSSLHDSLTDEDSMIKPTLLLDLAKTLDEAGIESLPILEETYAVLKESDETDSVMGSREGAIADLAFECARRNCTEMAQAVLNLYLTDTKSRNSQKMLVLAEIASIELNNGLSQEQFGNLSQEQLAQLKDDPDENLQRALVNFGL